MEKKEYPMDDHYNQALEFVVQMIAERDEMLKQTKFLPPEARPEGLRLLAQLTERIEEGEQKLAEEYEATQNLRRLEEERDKKYDELTESLSGAYVHAKYRHPELVKQLDEVIAGMPPDQAKEFHECAARHEAGDLIKIIAREGETREETEEFLKNYRAAQNIL